MFVGAKVFPHPVQIFAAPCKVCGWCREAIAACRLWTETSLVSSFGKQICPEGVAGCFLWLTGVSGGEESDTNANLGDKEWKPMPTYSY